MQPARAASGDIHGFMNSALRIATGIAAKQPKHGVGIPPAMADSMAEEIILATDPVTI